MLRAGAASCVNTLDSLRLAHCTPPRDRSREILAFDVLHRKKQMTLGIADVIDAAYVRMRDLPRDADLAMKGVEPVLVGGQRRRQELERDRVSEPQIVGVIDDAHATASELADDAIAAGLDRTGLDRAGLCRMRRHRRPGHLVRAERLQGVCARVIVYARRRHRDACGRLEQTAARRAESTARGCRGVAR